MKPKLIPTDVPNPIGGGWLYVYAVRVPAWRRWYDFIRLTWMLWGADWDGRIALTTAANMAWGLSRREWRPVDAPAGPEGNAK